MPKRNPQFHFRELAKTLEDGAEMVAGRVDKEASRSDTLTTARRVNTGLYRFVRSGNGPIAGLKIRCDDGCSTANVVELMVTSIG